MVQPDQFNDMVATLRSHGYVPYLVLEEQEEREFRARFSAATEYGRLQWDPLARYQGYTTALIYALNDPIHGETRPVGAIANIPW
jgi:hypothetical protein